MKKTLFALALLIAGGLSGLSAQDTTYHGYYNYYGNLYTYDLIYYPQTQHLYYNQYTLWFGSGAYCNVYPTPNDNIDFAFQMPCGCLGGCNAVMKAYNQGPNTNMHSEGEDYDLPFGGLQQDFAWDYNCSWFYTGPQIEYSTFYGCA